MSMPVYIESASAISAQQSFDRKLISEGLVLHPGNRLQAVEPDYSSLIDARQIRRMSRIIRMSVAAAKQTMIESGHEIPDAIIVGTALGCLDDTNSFLSKMVEYNEDMLSPTAFIHSTHNTIASQIALHFKCYGYNSTYVHKSISFESALNDALLLLNEGNVKNVLAGGADEIIDNSFHLMDRLGMIRHDENNKGMNAGEGASFFSLTTSHHAGCISEIKFAESWSFVEEEKVISQLKILVNHSPALVLAGTNGDASNDEGILSVLNDAGISAPVLPYKSFCGEYGTASAFALWLANEILKTGTVPANAGITPQPEQPIKNILIYNRQGNIHHSAILLEAC